MSFQSDFKFRIANLVYCTRLDSEIDLVRLSTALGPSAHLEPERFPGVRAKQRCSWTIHRSGSINVTGCKSKTDLQEDWHEIKTVLPSPGNEPDWRLVNSSLSMWALPSDYERQLRSTENEYNPEISPAILIRARPPMRGTCNLSRGGHAYIQGIRSSQELAEFTQFLQSLGLTLEVTA